MYSTNFTWSTLEYFVPYVAKCWHSDNLLARNDFTAWVKSSCKKKMFL